VPDARSRAKYLTYTTLGAALQRLPEPAANGIAALVGEVMARRPGPTHDMAVRHLRRILAQHSPHAAPDDALVERMARRSFRAYARYWVEGARLPATTPAEVAERMTIESGYEHLKDAMARGKGVVMALPHVGSWEWGGYFLASDGFPMTSVAEQVEPPELFEWFIEQRRAMGLTIVALGADSSGAVLRALRAGGLVGLLCDRDLVGNGVPVEFFGERTTLPAGPATLALRTGATLISAVVYSGPGRDHTGVISPPFDTTRRGNLRADVARITQDIARQLETFIARAPEQWHMFQPNWPSDTDGAAGSGLPADPDPRPPGEPD
jgi:lauroyl/myristoyl acyltransferase